MNDIDQFRELLEGNTESINMDAVVPKNEKVDNGHWTGIVVNNCDPEQLGKIQIKIYGYYDDLAINNIPWAIPDINSFTSKVGNFVIPEINTIVRGYFDNGDEMKPIYNSVAFNSIYTSKESNPFEWNMRTTDYPNTMVLFQTDMKDYLVMNKKTR